MSRWYVIRTHVNRERVAVANLRAQGFTAYLPVYRKIWRHARREEVRLAALFPRYLFIRLDLARDRWHPVLSTSGVQALIMNDGIPTPVPAGLVEELQVAGNDGDPVPLHRWLSFRKGERVSPISGPFAGHVGKFEDLKDDERASILLDILGRDVRVTVQAEHLARAS